MQDLFEGAKIISRLHPTAGNNDNARFSDQPYCIDP